MNIRNPAIGFALVEAANRAEPENPLRQRIHRCAAAVADQELARLRKLEEKIATLSKGRES